MNPIKEKCYELHLDLFKYIRRNPQNGGMELLERFEKLLLTEDLIFGSKKELKDKMKVIVKNEEEFVTFETNLVFRHRIPKHEYIMLNINDEEIKKLVKEEFVDCLEIDYLSKHFI